MNVDAGARGIVVESRDGNLRSSGREKSERAQAEGQNAEAGKDHNSGTQSSESSSPHWLLSSELKMGVPKSQVVPQAVDNMKVGTRTPGRSPWFRPGMDIP